MDAAPGPCAPVPTASRGDDDDSKVCACRAVTHTNDLLLPLAVLLVGALLGMVLPALGGGDTDGSWEGRVSGIIGWMYTFAWSVSFYPQVVVNFRSRSVAGLSLDYQMLNFTGFACYFAFNASMYYNDYVKQEYREAHDGTSSTVQFNDVVFAGNAGFATLITLVQIMVYYDYPPLLPPEKVLRRCVCCSLAVVCCGIISLALLIALQDERHMTWLSFLFWVSQVKVVISIVKYMPQVWFNFRRRSTVGWSITNVLLDFAGGILSTAQLLFDAWRENALSGITGDIAKLFLGSISVIFDVIFMFQHYCLYRHIVSSTNSGDGGAGLLHSSVRGSA